MSEKFYVETELCSLDFYKSQLFEASIDNTAYFRTFKQVAISSSTASIDWRNGNHQYVNITTSCTLSFLTAPRGVTRLHLYLRVTDNGSYTLTFSSSSGAIVWLGTAPTTIDDNKTLCISCFYDGIRYYCTPVGWFYG